MKITLSLVKDILGLPKKNKLGFSLVKWKMQKQANIDAEVN